MRLYIGNLPWETTEAQLRDLFKEYPIERVKLVTDRETGRPRGFGFVDTSGDPQAIISAFDGIDFGGRTIVVNIANEKPNTPRNGTDRPRGSSDKPRSRPPQKQHRGDDDSHGW